MKKYRGAYCLFLLGCILSGCQNLPSVSISATPKPSPSQFPLPTGGQQTLSVGDPVCIIEKEWFQAEAEVLEVGPQAYRIRQATNRGASPWVPKTRTFRSPYLGHQDWKVGQAVVVKHFGDFADETAKIVQLPTSRHGSYQVKMDNGKNESLRWLEAKKLFNEIRPATLKDIKAGDVLSKKPGYWVLVMGIQGDHVVVRQGPSDELLPVEQLEICR